MRLKTIRYQRTFNIDNFENVQLSAEIELDAQDQGQEHIAVERLRQFVLKTFINQMRQEGRHDILNRFRTS